MRVIDLHLKSTNNINFALSNKFDDVPNLLVKARKCNEIAELLQLLNKHSKYGLEFKYLDYNNKDIIYKAVDYLGNIWYVIAKLEEPRVGTCGINSEQRRKIIDTLQWYSREAEKDLSVAQAHQKAMVLYSLLEELIK